MQNTRIINRDLFAWPPRGLAFGLAVALVAAIGGCSVAGSWRTVSVTPADATPPVETMTFDRSHLYTATWRDNGRTHTDTGEYRFTGSRLELNRPGDEPRSYPARLRLDGKLELVVEKPDAPVTAVLEKKE